MFLFVFGLWQVIHILINVRSPSIWLRHFAQTAVQIASLVASLWFIKREGSDFQEHGFWWPDPESPLKYVSVSALLVLAYTFITVFLPGSLIGFELRPPASEISLEIIEVLFTGLASECVFRGYIQTHLTKVYGFPRALCITSVMFCFHRIPLLSLPTLNLISIFNEPVYLFMTGMFLGFFFQRARTLVCPVTFHMFLLLGNLVSFKAATGGYLALLFVALGYIFLIPLVYILVVRE